jgi:hypothetical protein
MEPRRRRRDQGNPQGGFRHRPKSAVPTKGPQILLFARQAKAWIRNWHWHWHLLFTPQSSPCGFLFPLWFLVLVLGKDDRWEGAELGRIESSSWRGNGGNGY